MVSELSPTRTKSPDRLMNGDETRRKHAVLIIMEGQCQWKKLQIVSERLLRGLPEAKYVGKGIKTLADTVGNI